MPPKGGNKETTSPRVASIASELLSNPKTPPRVKSVAAAALTNAANRPRGGGKKK